MFAVNKKIIFKTIVLTLTLFISLLSNLSMTSAQSKTIKPVSSKINKQPKAVIPSLVQGDKFLALEYRVLNTDSKYLWASGPENRSVLYKSSDNGETWEKVFDFGNPIEAVYITERGIMLVSTSRDGWSYKANSQVWRSANKGRSFKPVLKVKSGVPKWFSFASDKDGYVYVAEYGYKQLPDNARRIYKSSDDGQTWQLSHQPSEMYDYHDHKILVDDQNPNVIYQSIGDFHYKAILKSTDRGKTWKKVITGIHPISAVQFGNYILWGLDDQPESGIVLHNKLNDSWRYIFKPPAPYFGSIYDMMYVNDIIYAGLQSYKEHTWPGSIFISRDKGKTWTKWVDWQKKPGQEIFFYKLTYQGDYGYVWVTLPMNDKNTDPKYKEPDGYFRGTIRFPLIKP